MSVFSKPSVAILMVCTANICRSPMAEGLLREELKLRGLGRKVGVESAGTAALVGHIADGRAQLVCGREGIDLRKSRARQVIGNDFLRFNYILAMDQSNQEWLLQFCPQAHRDRISRLGSWATDGPIDDITDPYFGSPLGFEKVLLTLHSCIDGFLVHLLEELKRIGE
jgi:protein-tyrosine phosphatase